MPGEYRHAPLPPTGRDSINTRYPFHDNCGTMGRITKSFRIQFQEEIRTLKKFRNALVDVGHRDAFDRLLKVWGSTQGAMAYADIPYVLDAMVLTAVVDNRKRIMQLSSRLNCVTAKMTEIQKKLEPRVKKEFVRGYKR